MATLITRRLALRHAAAVRGAARPVPAVAQRRGMSGAAKEYEGAEAVIRQYLPENHHVRTAGRAAQARFAPWWRPHAAADSLRPALAAGAPADRVAAPASPVQIVAAYFGAIGGIWLLSKLFRGGKKPEEKAAAPAAASTSASGARRAVYSLPRPRGAPC